MPNYLLFQAYTKQQVAQCRYFLLKYVAIYNLKPHADTMAVVYTNDPVAFEGFTNFFPQFQMPGITPTLTATKTALLHHFFQQHNGAVLYCDTATYPLQPLEHLFTDLEKGALYLHSPRRFTEAELVKAQRRFSAVHDKTATAVATPLSAHITVWDTSVIGLHSRNKDLIQNLLQEESNSENALASDYNYTKVFSELGKLKSAAKYISEYSSLPEFGQLLETFFKKNDEENIPNQVKLVHHLDAAAIQQQKEAYQQQPLFKKWLQVIAGKRWSIQQYAKKF